MKSWLIRLTLVICTGCVFGTNAASPTTIDELLNLDPQNVQLASLSAVVIDVESALPLYWKHGDVVVPIASITKLMSAMVLLDSRQSLDEILTVSRAGFNPKKSSYSRMRPHSRISRRDLLRLSLMSSENLATYVLAAKYPGGVKAFVRAMNKKAWELNMKNSRFKDPTGLNAENESTASDLLLMVRAAMKYPTILEFSTTAEYVAKFTYPRYRLQYRNTNPLVRKGEWNIGLSKTGFINEAGRCLVMLTEISGLQVAMVLLDSFGKRTPMGDAKRIRKWLTTGESGKVAKSALRYEQKKRMVYNLGKPEKEQKI